MTAFFHPLSLLLATMCIQWVVLASLGQFSIKLPYAALALVILFALTGQRRIRACLLFVRQNGHWILPFVLYVILLSAALFGSGGHNPGPRQIFYLIGCIAFAGCLAAARDMGAVLRAGATLAVVFFIVVVEVMARGLGLSWLDAIREFLTGGDLHYVVFSFLRPVFNSLNPGGEVTFVASQKNAIAVCLLVALLLFRAGSAKPRSDFIGMFHTAVVLFLLLMLNTRSVIIVAGLSLVLTMALGELSKQVHNLHFLTLKALTAILALGVAISLTSPTPVAELIGDRFAFDDASAAARVIQFEAAIERIEEHPITGSGFYEVAGYTVHNLFLSAWMNAGIAAFLLVVTFYLLLVGRWVSFVWTLVRNPERWVLPLAPEWVAPLPLLPFFRVWLSGDGGNLFLGEWLAVAAFLGLILANDLRRIAIGAVETTPAVEQPPVLRPQRTARPTLAARKARLR
jgi:O-antigen ligase